MEVTAWDVSFHDIPRSSSVSSDDQSHLLLSPSTIYEDGGGYGGYGMGYSNMNNFPELRGYSARRRYSRDCE